VKTPHDIKVRRAGHAVTVWCKTHGEVLFTWQGHRTDVPLAEVLEAVAEHRGKPRTVGHCQLRRLPDGTYRFDMDGVNLSAAMLGGSNFVIHENTEGPGTMITLTLAVDSVDVAAADVRVIDAKSRGDEATYTYGLIP
jgi:hypothetical protein